MYIEYHINQDEFMYCRPECRDRCFFYMVVMMLGRQRSTRTLKYYGTNKYDAHKDSYQVYYKYNI